jgi:thioredoxin reductase
MPDVIVVRGGPAGLSAALVTAKNGRDTVVFDDDGIWMHKAHLFDYLGIGSLDGRRSSGRPAPRSTGSASSAGRARP